MTKTNYSGNGYTVNATADFSFNGANYHVKDFENANGRKVEVYSFYGADTDCAGMEKFEGYAADLGLVGNLAKLALGLFDVEISRRASDDGICALSSANFEAALESDSTSGGLRVYAVERDSGRIRCDGEHFGDVASVRSYLGELEIERLDRAVSALPMAA